jgi:glucose/arabinose dehydrogenase/PKD repeat protein
LFKRLLPALRRALGGSSFALIGLVLLASVSSARAGVLPSGFHEREVFSGLTAPTSLAFSPDGRVFVAEKSGVIKVFDSLTDPTPTVFADLSNEVYNYWDRGLLGIVLDPEFPTKPYVYVLYTRDAEPGEAQVPKWGGSSASDTCPSPPGPTTDGCVVTGRLSKLTVVGDTMIAETPLITDWCQQFPSHSIGDLAFGPEDDLFVSGGEGANFNSADWGQSGEPVNPCGDPPGGVGATLSAPAAEGGALRAQDVRTLADPTGLDGAVLRIDPNTGEGVAGNPFGSSSDANARRIVAFGLRNPFRLTVRPGTGEVWVGDVGWGTWEEIDRISNPAGPSAANFGWPCYEGGDGGVSIRQGAYEGAGLDLCKSLYAAGPAAVAAPYYAYEHSAQVVPGESCATGSSSTSGLAFYGGSSFPARYDGALFFADYSRNCIWAMLPGAGGLPDPAKIEPFDEGAAAPVNLIEGPGGSLYYPDLSGGKIWRISYTADNGFPVASATATPNYGLAPLSVQLDARDSSDPNPGDTLSYAWDLDGDGQFDDSTEAAPRYTYTTNGTHVAKVRVTDGLGASDVASVPIQVGNTPPSVSITAPSPSLTWAVGDHISYSATATDPQDGTLPPSAYKWKIIVHHCPSNCHLHVLEEVSGVKSGSLVAPDHEYPSWLEIQLTVTDSGGLTATQSVEVHPKTVNLNLETSPPGIDLDVNDLSTSTAGSAITLIQGSTATLSAPSPQTVGGTQYVFQSWSDGGGAAHNVVVGKDETLKATFAAASEAPKGAPSAAAAAAPTITATDPASPGPTRRPAVSGALGARSGATIAIFTNASCAGSPAVRGTPADFAGNGIQVTVAANASTVLSADANNAAGTSACSKPQTYVEDSTPPETTISSSPRARRASSAAGARARFAFTANEPALRFECSLDHGHFGPCSSPRIYRKLKPGRHRFEVRAVDLAGNVDPTPAIRRFNVSGGARTATKR